MKLYCHPASINSRKSRLAAAVLGIDLELELVDVTPGRPRDPGYLALNPNGMVPTLVDGDFVLWESNAIAQYLASLRRSPDLYPDEPRVRADVVRWLCWDLAHWTPATQTLSFERMFRPLLGLGASDQAAVRAAGQSFHRFASVLDRHLDKRDYLVGGRLSLADLSIAAGLTFASGAALPVAEYRRLAQWFGRIERLDAWQSTAPAGMG